MIRHAVALIPVVFFFSSCGSGVFSPCPPVTTPLLSVSPIALEDLNSIEPMGHMSPSGHTFPTLHTYFKLTTWASAPDTSKNLYAPADFWITKVQNYVYDGRDYEQDYRMAFSFCSEVTGYFNHVSTMSEDLAKQVGTFPTGVSSGTADETMTIATKSTSIFVKAGTLMGTVGVAGQVDFGITDKRSTRVYANPVRNSYQLNGVCPLDYYETPLKTVLESYLGGTDGSRRTDLPLCGKNGWDVLGSAQGNWVTVGSSPTASDSIDTTLALIPHNYYDGYYAFSVGHGISGEYAGKVWIFTTESTGDHNRKFADVTSDGTIYCYDTLKRGISLPTLDYHILVQMADSATLKMELQSGAACPAVGARAFGANLVTLER